MHLSEKYFPGRGTSIPRKETWTNRNTLEWTCRARSTSGLGSAGRACILPAGQARAKNVCHSTEQMGAWPAVPARSALLAPLGGSCVGRRSSHTAEGRTKAWPTAETRSTTKSRRTKKPPPATRVVRGQPRATHSRAPTAGLEGALVSSWRRVLGDARATWACVPEGARGAAEGRHAHGCCFSSLVSASGIGTPVGTLSLVSTRRTRRARRWCVFLRPWLRALHPFARRCPRRRGFPDSPRLRGVAPVLGRQQESTVRKILSWA